jgi:3-oxoacyl-[acyl-carrier-protein] synthase-3
MMKIAGTGHAVPAKCDTPDTLDRRLGCDVTLFADTDVEARNVYEDETRIDLAVVACQVAIEDAHLVKDDMVISGSAVPYQTLPATAQLIMRMLRIADGCASAFDVTSTCIGFLTGVDMATEMIAGHRGFVAQMV